ncbi:MAG: LuxR C-terminal-related transcriptional regulator [Pirellulales bacterium]
MLISKRCFTLPVDPAASARITAVCSRTAVENIQLSSWDSLFARQESLTEGCVIASLGEMTDSDPIFHLRRLLEQTTLGVVLLADNPPTRYIVQAVRLGVVEILEWPREIDRLELSLGDALRISATLRVQKLNATSAYQRVSELRREERDVLDLMLQGKLNKNIASTLGIALRTVEARRKRIFSKLGTRSLAEIAVLLSDARRETPGRPHFLSRNTNSTFGAPTPLRASN